jgi:hypothetical protein
LNPVEVLGTATAPELSVKADPLDLETLASRELLDLLRAAELTRPDDLVLIEQEYRDPCRVEQFVDLGPSSPERGPGESVDGCLANAVRLIENEDVQAVTFSVHELVEVFEELLDTT